MSSRVRTVVAVGEPLLGGTCRTGTFSPRPIPERSSSPTAATGRRLEDDRDRRAGAAHLVRRGRDGAAHRAGRTASAWFASTVGFEEFRALPESSVRRYHLMRRSPCSSTRPAGGSSTWRPARWSGRSRTGAPSPPRSRVTTAAIATGAADDTIRIWTRAGARIRALDQNGHPTALVSERPAPPSRVPARTASRASGSRARTPHAVLEGDATGLTDIGFSTDGAHVVTASEDGTVRVSNAERA